ncbi:glycosyltransferase family 1 protein [Bosea sp. AAP35]|uniref:glycosyltransferase family 4 protein n=1 Tax=Bosea sp. AAP35 TaxID=1523417 RepID=UPI0006B9C414|nr:glycosyltransferase family 1 protein [Bosea sp. AAP35]
MPIAYDVTRLMLGPLSLTPRGIDRVDLAYARHFFEHSPEDCFALLPTAWGTRLFPRERVLRGLTKLEELWSENRLPAVDGAWMSLAPTIQAGKSSWYVRSPGAVGLSLRLFSLLKATGFEFGTDAVSGLPQGSIYVNVGQIGLAVPFLLRWLQRRPDVRPLFMLHDVIPLEMPEYVSPGSVKAHATMVDQTAKYAAGLIVTTQTAKAAIDRELARRSARPLPTIALPLPIPAIFRSAPDPDPTLAHVPYFVVCGAIELRKNHLMLLEVWKRLHRRFGPATPHLVITGSKGWQGELIMDRLKRCGDVSDYIHVVHGLSTPGLKRVISGARALLMPSFIEGFGLPIVEAARLGTPVIASDISAHREVGHPQTRFVDPIDGPGWENAITDYFSADHIRLTETVGYAELTWPAYFSALSAFMRDLQPNGNMINR